RRPVDRAGVEVVAQQPGADQSDRPGQPVDADPPLEEQERQPDGSHPPAGCGGHFGSIQLPLLTFGGHFRRRATVGWEKASVSPLAPRDPRRPDQDPGSTLRHVGTHASVHKEPTELKVRAAGRFVIIKIDESWLLAGCVLTHW